MPRYQIEVKKSGVVLAPYEAPTADEAVEAMARDAGYKSFRDMCSISDPDDLDAEVERQRDGLFVSLVE